MNRLDGGPGPRFDKAFCTKRPRIHISTCTSRCRSQNQERDSSPQYAPASSGPSRRQSVAAILFSIPQIPQLASAVVQGYEPMYGLKGKDYGKERQKYSDYERTESGLQYQNLREGQGETPQQGSTVAIDWDGYTIGYYGRPFQARNKAKGGSFGQGAERELYKFTINGKEAIPAVEEAVLGMKPGGIRRLIVPVELGYPDNDFKKKGPKPTTFSGERALDFVLRNQGLIDKTLLIDIELVKIY